MYYKIIKNGYIIDVNDVFLAWQPRNRSFYHIEPEYAEYIQTSDLQNIYITDWTLPTKKGSPIIDSIEAIIIEKEEYLDLLQKLQNATPLEHTINEEVVIEEVQQPQEPVSIPLGQIELLQKLIALEEQNVKLLEQNIFLEDCILELSQELYK